MRNSHSTPEGEPRSRPKTGGEAQDRLFRLSSAVVLAAALISFLVILLVLRSRPDGDSGSAVPPQAEGEALGAGADQTAPSTGEAAALPVLTPEPGIVPDLEMRHGLVAIGALVAADLPYIVIQVENDDVPSGTVFRQSPAPGTRLEEGVVVTLLVSR